MHQRNRVVPVGAVALAALLVGGLARGATASDPGTRHETRPVDVVLGIDASGSMENLLDSARARLWDIVNRLATLRPTPELRVGLISYGTSAGTVEGGWIVTRLDLTDDLDRVYAELMALETGGSDEYVGRMIDTALDEMSWSPEWNALRILFIAGNESADQGVEDHDFRVALSAAVDRGIIVNALYAGNREQGISEHWPELARLGSGNFSAIDPETGTIQIPAPQDGSLLQLNEQLNATYVPYGERGSDGMANQVAQDTNATRLGVQSCSSRIVAKGSALYTNASWDLVDASLLQGFDWSEVERDLLPEELRGMSDEALRAWVEHRRAARETIQLEIQRVSAEREAYIRAVRLRETGAAGLGDAMNRAICTQATERGFAADGC